MFIVCPSCSGPYRIAADQIAPLVQTACPHCEYRVILDFEAANDPSLREAGTQLAQGFESIEAYASVYDHVTSKPGVQPRPGVTSVTSVSAQPEARAVASASTSSPARPLQRPEPSSPGITPPAATPAATPASTPAAQATGGSRHKTVLQVPSKKPVSMDPRGESPSLSGAAATPSGTSMRAGKGVDVVDEPRAEEPKVEARTRPASEPSERKPPHTPPTTGVVSSGPPASETPTPPPEDIAAQSGKHPVEAQPAEPKPTEAKPAETKPAETKPPAPTPGGSNVIYYIIAVVVIGGVIALVLMNR